MKFNVKWARQGVMMALVAIAAAWMGAQVTVQHHQQFGQQNYQYTLAEDGPKPCPTC
jgi:hypothetical protein